MLQWIEVARVIKYSLKFVIVKICDNSIDDDCGGLVDIADSDCHY